MFYYSYGQRVCDTFFIRYHYDSDSSPDKEQICLPVFCYMCYTNLILLYFLFFFHDQIINTFNTTNNQQ